MTTTVRFFSVYQVAALKRALSRPAGIASGITQHMHHLVYACMGGIMKINSGTYVCESETKKIEHKKLSFMIKN